MPTRIPDPNTVGSILKGFRVDRGLTQEALAAASGFDRTYIGMVERGERKPTVHAVSLMLDVLGVSWTKMGQALDAARGQSAEHEPGAATERTGARR